MIAVIIPICLGPKKLEVCCDSVSYPTYSQQINDDLANLRKNGNLKAINAYIEWATEQLQHPPWPVGEYCIEIGDFRGSQMNR